MVASEAREKAKSEAAERAKSCAEAKSKEKAEIYRLVSEAIEMRRPRQRR